MVTINKLRKIKIKFGFTFYSSATLAFETEEKAGRAKFDHFEKLGTKGR